MISAACTALGGSAALAVLKACNIVHVVNREVRGAPAHVVACKRAKMVFGSRIRDSDKFQRTLGHQMGEY
jgi:hypothetical protein